MNARYWPCLGVKTGRESLATRFIVALDSGGSAMNIRYRVELSEAERARLRGLAPLFLHALHIAFEPVQPLLPDGPLFAKPILGHDEARWHKTVAALATLLRRLEQARLLENTKVLGEGWQSHLIRLGEFGH
jgi:hypothetical protein